MANKYSLCKQEELTDNEAIGFTLELDTGPLEIFIIRKGDQVHGYINRCPHTGVNLDWTPGQFLDREGKFIQCSTHGAKFQIKDGYCILGSCAGQSLSQITVIQENGLIKPIC